MGAVIEYEKDGYVFNVSYHPIPWVVARIDENGNRVPLSWKEMEEWRENYIKEHPEKFTDK